MNNNILTKIVVTCLCIFGLAFASNGVIKVDNAVPAGTEMDYSGIKPGESRTYDAEKAADINGTADINGHISGEILGESPNTEAIGFTVNSRSTQVEVYFCTDSWGGVYEMTINSCRTSFSNVEGNSKTSGSEDSERQLF